MAKVDPYLRPLFDALHDMIEPRGSSSYLERGQIEVAPLAFMRGRTLNDSFIILDEAQNTTPEQMKMFLTRLGFNSKMVVTGDITQIDLPEQERVRARRRRGHARGHRRHRVRPLRRRGRRAPPARAADRRRLRRARRAPDARAAAGRSPPRLTSSSVEARAWRSSASTIDVVDELRAAGGDRAAARAGVRVGRHLDGHVAVEFVRAERIQSSTASTAARTPRPTCCRSRSTGRDGRHPQQRRPAELGDIVICPPLHRGPARGDRARRAAPHRHGSRDRRRRDARGAARDHALGHAVTSEPAPRAASSRSPVARTSASRRSSTRSSARRSRSSPTSRRRRAARSAGSRCAGTRSSCSSTCRACSARATR